MNNYQKQAGELYHLAKQELNRAKRSSDENIARDAAGKAWIATTDAVRGFLLLNGLKEKDLPKSERQRHNLLGKYGDEKMLQLYFAIRGAIHQDAYYEGIINYTVMFASFKSVQKLIYHCKNSH